MIRALIVGSALLAMAGCVSVKHVPMTDQAAAQLQGKSVARTQYPMPDFSAMTAGKAAFGLVGAAAMISEGNGIIKDNGIGDPALAIGKGLADKLVAARGVRLVESTAVAASDAIPALVSTYPGVDYLLDVKTFNWMFGYYPTDWAHYRVMYSARLRLIDTASKQVVAETMCQSTQGDDANPPSKDQLLENGAALLKTYFGNLTTACIDVLSKEVLRI